MTSRHALFVVALCTLALTLFACVEPEPYSPPPVVDYSSPPPSPPPTFYFVNVSGLALREGPTTAAPQITSLNFNDQVEILDTSGSWARVRVTNLGLTGWASMRYLQPMPSDRPRPVPSKRPSAPKKETPPPAPKAM